MDVLERLVAQAAVGLGALGGLAATVVVGWKFLWVILSGGSERALASLIKFVATIVVTLAVLSNLPEAAAMLQTLAGLLFRAVVEAVQSASAGV